MFRKILTHLIIWSIYFLLEVFANYFHYGPDHLPKLAGHILSYIPFIILATYWTYYRAIPRFLVKKNQLLLFLELIGVVLFIYLSRYLWSLYQFNINRDNMLIIPWSKVIKNTIKDISIVSLASCILFIRDWRKQEGIINKLQQTNAEQKLELVMQQLQPHFLFNTINNIYSLIRQNPEKGADSLLLLSDVLEYFLHTQVNQKVPLEEEVAIAKKYIHLHSLKYGKRLSVEWKLRGVQELSIPPLLIVAILENAFKHGSPVEGQFKLHIECVKKEKKVQLIIINSVDGVNGMEQQSHRGNTILKNLLRLHYNESFSMNMNRESNLYNTQIEWKDGI